MLGAGLATALPAVPAPPVGAFMGGVGNFLGDFGKSFVGQGVQPGELFPPDANIAQILGTILGNTKVQTGNFQFQGPAQSGRKRGMEEALLMRILNSPRILGGGSNVVQTNPRPQEATTSVR